MRYVTSSSLYFPRVIGRGPEPAATISGTFLAHPVRGVRYGGGSTETILFTLYNAVVEAGRVDEFNV